MVAEVLSSATAAGPLGWTRPYVRRIGEVATRRNSPAWRLEGSKLNEGWEVVRLIKRPEELTGASFSVGYEVACTDGRRGFLKALDYSGALRMPDPVDALQKMTTAYLFERDLLRACAARGLDRVVYSIAAGRHEVDDSDLGRVDYLIFEMARGDIRAQLAALDELDLSWALRTLHHVAVGLAQLHGVQIAHQDLKPSNVLIFHEDVAKLGDLGRAALRGEAAPHEEQPFAGDPTHAPPELLYGHVPADWNCRRLGCDLYHLGSMVTFVFQNVSMTGAALSRIPAGYHFKTWKGPYREVLPYLRDAIDSVASELETNLGTPVGGPIAVAVRQLCEPDPELRGHPANRLGYRDRYSVERYVSLFDLLARRVEYGLRLRRTSGRGHTA